VESQWIRNLTYEWIPDKLTPAPTLMASVMEIDHVGFGPDTFFGDHVGLHVLYAGNLDTGEVGEYEPVEYVEGMENPSEFPNVIRWLVGHGYTDEQIAKVVGGTRCGPCATSGSNAARKSRALARRPRRGRRPYGGVRRPLGAARRCERLLR
jgi:hypothetical protein